MPTSSVDDDLSKQSSQLSLGPGNTSACHNPARAKPSSAKTIHNHMCLSIGICTAHWGADAEETATASFCLTYSRQSHTVKGMTQVIKQVLEEMEKAADTPEEVSNACADVLHNTDMLPQ